MRLPRLHMKPLRRFGPMVRDTSKYDRLAADYADRKLSPETAPVAALALEVFGFNLRLERQMRRQRIENRVLYGLALLLTCLALGLVDRIDSERDSSLDRQRAAQLAGCDRTNELRKLIPGAEQIPCRKVYPPLR